MKIIISPAKKMRIDNDDILAMKTPIYLDKTKRILQELQNKSYQELCALWQCNTTIAEVNYKRLQQMQLDRNLTMAVLAYDGIQYQYMAPRVFEEEQFLYINKNLKILSGFYGILDALDGVVPYRLEMQAKLSIDKEKNLYDFWGNKPYQRLVENDKIILNLASKEYSKIIEKYLEKDVVYKTCIFGVWEESRVKVKATEAKMARGTMVRWCAEEKIENINEIKQFTGLSYKFEENLSNDDEFVFLKQKQK